SWSGWLVAVVPTAWKSSSARLKGLPPASPCQVFPTGSPPDQPRSRGSTHAPDAVERLRAARRASAIAAARIAHETCEDLDRGRRADQRSGRAQALDAGRLCQLRA